jgi:hypothetical protein
VKTHIHIFISGRTERIGHDTGTKKAREYVEDAIPRPLDAHTIIRKLEWNSDWNAVADMIADICQFDSTVSVYAYSWGAGYGARKLAKFLAERGICINTAVLCDPVYRSRFLPFRFLALTRFPKIKWPANVLNIWQIYQRSNRPHGHLPILTDGKAQRIHLLEQVPETRHNTIDDSQRYRDLCLTVATKVQRGEI